MYKQNEIKSQGIALVTPQPDGVTDVIVAKYRDRLLTAWDEVKTYDGTSRSMGRVITSFAKAEDIATSANGGKVSVAFETLLTEKADIRDDGVVLSGGVADVMMTGVARYYDALAEQSTQDIIRFIADSGGKVHTSDSVYIPTNEKEIVHGSQTSFKQGRTEQRLAWLIEGLQSMDIYPEDIEIHQGAVESTMMRREPYMIVTLAKPGKQILVCNQVGETCFTSDTIRPPEFYAGKTKDELGQTSGMLKLQVYSRKLWIRNISAFLTDAVENETSQDKDKKITLDRLVEICKEFYDKNGKAPSEKSGIAIEEERKTFKAIHQAISVNSATVSEELHIYKGLPDFCHQNNIGVLQENELLKICMEYEAEHGKEPSTHSAGTFSGMTFSAVNLALRKKSKTVSPSLKEKYDSLHDFCQKNGIGEDKIVIGKDNLIDVCSHYYRDNGKVPSRKSGVTAYGKKFAAINSAIALNLGTVKDDLHDYASLSDFCQKNSEMIIAKAAGPAEKNRQTSHASVISGPKPC